MKTRILTSIITLPLLILPIYYGGVGIFIFVFLLSAIGFHEYFNAFQIKSKFLNFWGIITSFVFYILLWLDIHSYIVVLLTASIITLLFYYVLKFPKYDLKTIGLSAIGLFYIPLLLSFITLIRSEDTYGVWFVWLVFLIAFGTDTFAYFGGRFFGKHKLAKQLSPKKTIEGAIGGIIGAIALCLLYGYYMYTQDIFTDLSILPYMVLLGGIGSILSQLGDLVASAIKRQNQLKDFGSLLPGHGGILDRFDSNIFTAPFVYYIMILFI